MKKIFAFSLTTCLFLTSISAHAETTVCDGRWQNDQPVHVVVNWNTNIVTVNNTSVLIFGVNDNGSGIATRTYSNSFGHPVYFAVANIPVIGDIVVQFDGRRHEALQYAELSCSKSFNKPFMNRMLKTN